MTNEQVNDSREGDSAGNATENQMQPVHRACMIKHLPSTQIN